MMTLITRSSRIYTFTAIIKILEHSWLFGRNKHFRIQYSREVFYYSNIFFKFSLLYFPKTTWNVHRVLES